jgi:hypothetical protein
MTPLDYFGSGVLTGLGIWICVASLRSMYKELRKY